MKRTLILSAGLMVSAVLFASGYRESHAGIRIELEGNPTMGYSWTYTAGTAGIVKEISADYVKNETTPGIVGSGGVFVFVFAALAPGETELRFVYTRPWDSTIEPAREAVYRVKVDADKRISAEKRG
ncbi:MAG: protease inhibitor I42 family protein [Treponema sp.]|jgi:predicted secreted protein|nr:protease inhibitor I42 family protein [Treponema sp.]